MKRGYYVALAGLAIFIIAAFVGAFAGIEGDAAGVMIGGAGLVMVACFWLGTAIVAVEKGYPLLVGIVLGVLGLLGLLIITLLPERRRRVR